MNSTQAKWEDAKRFTHWATRDQTFSLTSTTEKPPNNGDWTTTVRETRSRLPLQKNLNTKEQSSCEIQGGIKTSEATYQMRNKARAFIIRDLPQKDKKLERQEDKTLTTALIRGRQLSSTKWPIPMNTPKTFHVANDPSRLLGGSDRPLQVPSQRPFDLARFSLEPDAFS